MAGKIQPFYCKFLAESKSEIIFKITNISQSYEQKVLLVVFLTHSVCTDFVIMFECIDIYILLCLYMFYMSFCVDKSRMMLVRQWQHVWQHSLSRLALLMMPEYASHSIPKIE